MPESRLIGSKHNTKPKPFEGEKILVHKQFNSPLKLYSMDNIRETLKAHSEQIVPGVMGYVRLTLFLFCLKIFQSKYFIQHNDIV